MATDKSDAQVGETDEIAAILKQPPKPKYALWQVVRTTSGKPVRVLAHTAVIRNGQACIMYRVQPVADAPTLPIMDNHEVSEAMLAGA